MVKQPPAPLKSAAQKPETSNVSSSQNKTASSLSTTSNKKKYGGSGASPNRSRSATKELILPPSDAASKAPQFTTALKSLTIGDGERLTLQCQVAGDPEPQVTWYKNGKKLESNDFVDLKYKYGLATLKIEEVYPEDAAEYKCVAKNYVNQAETQCTVKVKRKFKAFKIFTTKIFTYESLRICEIFNVCVYHSVYTLNLAYDHARAIILRIYDFL